MWIRIFYHTEYQILGIEIFEVRDQGLYDVLQCEQLAAMGNGSTDVLL